MCYIFEYEVILPGTINAVQSVMHMGEMIVTFSQNGAMGHVGGQRGQSYHNPISVLGSESSDQV